MTDKLDRRAAFLATLGLEEMNYAQTIGLAVMFGMSEVDRMGEFTGTTVIRNTYSTSFPMPDGREWAVTVALKEGGDPGW